MGSYNINSTLTGVSGAEYTLVEGLGGGISRVFLARDAKGTNYVAKLPDSRDISYEALWREREALDHLAAGSRGGRTIATTKLMDRMLPDGPHEPFLVLNYIEGEDLSDVFERHYYAGKLIHTLFVPLLRTLDEVHARDVIHGDVKPDNVRVTPNGSFLSLIDFGLSITPTTGGFETSRAVGTPPYMSLEQFKGETVPQSDLFSVGVMLYEALTGELPATGNSDDVYYSRLYDEPDPRQLRPTLPVDISDVVVRALQRNPGDRFASAGEFEAALNAVPALVR